MEYIKFNSGGKIDGICTCSFSQRKEYGNCLLDLAWEDWNEDRDKGMWSKRQFGGETLIPHVISFSILYVIITFFFSILFLFLNFFKAKKA